MDDSGMPSFLCGCTSAVWPTGSTVREFLKLDTRTCQAKLLFNTHVTIINNYLRFITCERKSMIVLGHYNV